MNNIFLTRTRIFHNLSGIEESSGVFEKFSRIFVITGKVHLKASDGYDRIVRFFSSLSGKDFSIFSDVTPNPTTDLVEVCYSEARKFDPDVVVAVGGGSVIDTAKAVSVKLANPGLSIWDYVDGTKSIEKAIPIIAIPTTAGTGSEVNRICVITNPTIPQKRSIKLDPMYPYCALLIPSMTVSLNKFLTAITAIDALSHAIEALVSRNSNFVTRAVSERAIRLIIENIFKVYNNGENLDARRELQFASVLSGIAVDISGVGLMHALEHPITARFPHIPHGQGLAILFRKVIENSFMFATDKFRVVAESMGIRVRGNSDYAVLSTMLDIAEYLLSYLDVKKRLSDFGVEKSDIKYLADDVVSYMGNSLRNSPYTPTRDSIEKIYREVL